MRSTILTTGLALLAAGASVAPLAGCRGDRTDKPPHRFFPDMDDEPKWDPQEATTFYADGKVGRETPAHAVAFGRVAFDPTSCGDQWWAEPFTAERDAMLADDPTVYRGVELASDGTESYIDDIPVVVTNGMVKRGQELFNIYCVACHGYLGDGKGMVGVRWNYPPANLTSALYRDRANRQGKDGYLFHTIRNGLNGPDGANRMPAYGHAIDEMEAWAVVAYIRALQEARGSAWADLPQADRDQLGAPTPPPADSGAPADEGAAMNGGAS